MTSTFKDLKGNGSTFGKYSISFLFQRLVGFKNTIRP
ncbi:hypothetical protein AAZX31_05G177900 [Glycine max]